MSVWLTMPSARPAAQVELVLERWRERGYKIALWRDDKDYYAEGAMGADECLSSPNYPGYANAANAIIGIVLDQYPDAEWFVCAGDDTYPDPNKTADEIAAECIDYFGKLNTDRWRKDSFAQAMRLTFDIKIWQTFGVMQPTGDRWHEGVGGFSNAPIDRVCGSPWIGKEFARRMYGGNGPYWPEYEHMYVDEELQNVAEKMGVLWQRRDLTHHHAHWGRGATDRAIVNDPKIPEHLVKWNTPQHWNKSRDIFQKRKAAGFPGHEPIA